MSPVRIVKRPTKDGKPRYRVIYRRGGRGFKDEWAGSFTTLREARQRRDWIAGLLAAGHDPTVELQRLREPARRRDLAAVYDAWAGSRHDVAAQTERSYRQARNNLTMFFGDTKAVDDITVQDCREYMGWLAGRYNPATVRVLWYPFAQALDFAEIEPNPARSRTVRKPRQVKVEPVVMPLEHFQAIVSALPERHRLFFRLLEATGMRVAELAALTWGDVDHAGSRFRVAAARSKGGYGQRWVQVPTELMAGVQAALPAEDRVPERPVFRVATDQARRLMRNACKTAGVPHYHPHDLRHRRLSLWHGQGVPAVELARRAGHSKVSQTLDRYSHVVVGDAFAEDPWAAAGPESERRDDES